MLVVLCIMQFVFDLEKIRYVLFIEVIVLLFLFLLLMINLHKQIQKQQSGAINEKSKNVNSNIYLMNNKHFSQNLIAEFYTSIIKQYCDRLEQENRHGSMYIPDEQIFSIRDKTTRRLRQPEKLMRISYDKMKLKEEKEREKRDYERHRQTEEQTQKLNQVKQEHNVQYPQVAGQYDDELFADEKKEVVVKEEAINQLKKQENSKQESQSDHEYEDRKRYIDQANESKDLHIIASFQTSRKKYTAKTEKTKMWLQNLFIKSKTNQHWYKEMDCEFTTLDMKQLRRM